MVWKTHTGISKKRVDPDSISNQRNFRAAQAKSALIILVQLLTKILIRRNQTGEKTWGIKSMEMCRPSRAAREAPRNPTHMSMAVDVGVAQP